MAYFPELQNARRWLVDNTNADGGWGMVAAQPSSMVNTAEVLFVLAKAGAPYEELITGLSFMRDNLDTHLETRGKRIRYVAFPLAVLSECFPDYDAALRKHLSEWLIASQNADGGWGEEANDRNSDVFSTFLATDALMKAGEGGDAIKAAGRWMSARHTEAGWSLYPDQRHSLAGTAYGVMTLLYAGFRDTSSFASGRELLLGTDNWEPEEVNIRGTRWHHDRASLIIRALSVTETDLFHPTLAEGVRIFQRRVHPLYGWTEKPSDNLPSIRSIYWAVAALSTVYTRLDPAIYIPRVDAERSQGVLLEPSFIPFAVNSRWHTIVPSSGFRVFVYFLLVAGFITASGLLERVPRLPSQVGAPIGVLMVAASAVLVRKRPKQFPRLFPWVNWIVAVTATLGFLFGFSVYDLLRLPNWLMDASWW